jgi:hypothetical protein
MRTGFIVAEIPLLAGITSTSLNHLITLTMRTYYGHKYHHSFLGSEVVVTLGASI